MTSSMPLKERVAAGLAVIKPRYINPRTIRWRKQQLRKHWEAGKVLDRRGRVRTPRARS